MSHAELEAARVVGWLCHRENHEMAGALGLVQMAGRHPIIYANVRVVSRWAM